MHDERLDLASSVLNIDEIPEPLGYGFRLRHPDESPSDEPPSGFTRRCFVQAVGAGLLVTLLHPTAEAQRRGGGRGSQAVDIASRVQIGKDGTITVLTGKVEGGQGARTEITQAAAEELHISAGRIQMVMADTARVPDDGITAGSRTTPSTLPSVRTGCAAAREVLVAMAATKWNVDPASLKAADGAITHAATQRRITYAELASGDGLARAMSQDAALSRPDEWKVLGTTIQRPNARDLVTGAHRFPSDITRPGMLYGKVLRPPQYGAKLTAIDLQPAKAMPDVIVVREGDFVGVAAPTSFRARQAIAAVAETAKWETTDHPSSDTLTEHLRRRARDRSPENPFASELSSSAQKLRQTYEVAYVQHAPLEPRAAVAEWEGDKLTVWTGTQNPFGCRSELARAFGLQPGDVRVIVPDFGAGFGGKHTGECGVEAARIARAAKRPVCLRWTRPEEFTWAYFRPAAVIDVTAGLDADGRITAWHFVNINSGQAAVETPYRIEKARSIYIPSDPPLRQGSYRALAATANNFARECAMDELAAAAGQDPLAFRLAHLDNPRLRAVLETAAKRFGWKERAARKNPELGVGLACGTEKGSFVAACVEVAIEGEEKTLSVVHVCEVFECGAVLNPGNLLAQIEGCIIMGMGPALREEIQFEGGKIRNAAFRRYPVPRFEDVPKFDIHVLDRTDLPSVGAGETPIIAIAPAIANAVFHASGQRIRRMPIRLGA